MLEIEFAIRTKFGAIMQYHASISSLLIALLVQGCVTTSDHSDDGCADLVSYVFLGEEEEDYAGYWVSSAGDVDGDKLSDVLVGAYDNDEGGDVAGAVYLILGKSLTESGTFDLSKADYKFIGEKAG